MQCSPLCISSETTKGWAKCWYYSFHFERIKQQWLRTSQGWLNVRMSCQVRDYHPSTSSLWGFSLCRTLEGCWIITSSHSKTEHQCFPFANTCEYFIYYYIVTSLAYNQTSLTLKLYESLTNPSKSLTLVLLSVLCNQIEEPLPSFSLQINIPVLSLSLSLLLLIMGALVILGFKRM